MPHGIQPGPAFQLAQLNIATTEYPLDGPEMADFMAALDRINALAEASDGFIWRMQDDNGNAMSFTLFDEKTIPNMSVWRDRESLFEYVYKSAHTEFLARRKEWFQVVREGTSVLWWIPAGHKPTIEEAGKRLSYLREHGPGPQAFTFKKAFDPAGEPV
ncbi:MAG: hypothetical protein COB37_03160 [Kordiimonadales bacterium]|nr:MAG: hypothetical protein COB37_03160 [Kordiimonadales bacterium]